VSSFRFQAQVAGRIVDSHANRVGLAAGRPHMAPQATTPRFDRCFVRAAPRQVVALAELSPNLESL